MSPIGTHTNRANNNTFSFFLVEICRLWEGGMESTECPDAKSSIPDEQSIIEGVSDPVLFVVILSVTFLVGIVTLLSR